MPDIMHLVKIRTPAAQVYEAVTTADGIHNWWTRDADVEDEVGGTAEFRFYEGRVATKVALEELAPSSRVVWKTIASTAPGGWKGTTISFDLREDGADTVLSFSHRGFAQADENYARVTTGWAYFLISLQQYLETGRGAPHPDVDFTRVIR
jgi:uncharacterized protein YndB with AHSA1/START domain